MHARICQQCLAVVMAAGAVIPVACNHMDHKHLPHMEIREALIEPIVAAVTTTSLGGTTIGGSAVYGSLPLVAGRSS